MSRFSVILRSASDRLDLPQPQKSRILLEIAADLEDMYDFYLGEGLGEQEAMEKAQEKFDLSDEALGRLVEIHESAFRRFFGLLSRQAQSKWEKGLLALIILFIAAYSGREAVSRELLVNAGEFIWPIAGFSAVTAGIAVWQIYRLYLKKDHDVRRLRHGISWLLLSGCGSALSGFLGASIGMYRTAALAQGDEGNTLKYLLDWGVTSTALQMAGLVSGIAAVMIWFALMNKARKVEEAEVSWLLQE